MRDLARSGVWQGVAGCKGRSWEAKDERKEEGAESEGNCPSRYSWDNLNEGSTCRSFVPFRKCDGGVAKR